jgi:DNA replication protein DnaD
MARAMFEYTKAILEKVSFNTELFKKELEKAVNRLLPFEVNELYVWLQQFTHNKPELYSCLVVVKNKKRSF